MNTKYCFLLFFFLSTLIPVNYVYADGNDILEACTEAEKWSADNNYPNLNHFNVGQCFAYLQAVRDTMMLGYNLGNCPKIPCFPKGGISNIQAMRIALKYLRNHPERLHEPEIILVWSAFKEAFPCD